MGVITFNDECTTGISPPRGESSCDAAHLQLGLALTGGVISTGQKVNTLGGCCKLCEGLSVCAATSALSVCCISFHFDRMVFKRTGESVSAEGPVVSPTARPAQTSPSISPTCHARCTTQLPSRTNPPPRSPAPLVLARCPVGHPRECRKTHDSLRSMIFCPFHRFQRTHDMGIVLCVFQAGLQPGRLMHRRRNLRLQWRLLRPDMCHLSGLGLCPPLSSPHHLGFC